MPPRKSTTKRTKKSKSSNVTQTVNVYVTKSKGSTRVKKPTASFAPIPAPQIAPITAPPQKTPLDLSVLDRYAEKLNMSFEQQVKKMAEERDRERKEQDIYIGNTRRERANDPEPLIAPTITDRVGGAIVDAAAYAAPRIGQGLFDAAGTVIRGVGQGALYAAPKIGQGLFDAAGTVIQGAGRIARDMFDDNGDFVADRPASGAIGTVPSDVIDRVHDGIDLLKGIPQYDFDRVFENGEIIPKPLGIPRTDRVRMDEVEDEILDTEIPTAAIPAQIVPIETLRNMFRINFIEDDRPINYATLKAAGFTADLLRSLAANYGISPLTSKNRNKDQPTLAREIYVQMIQGV